VFVSRFERTAVILADKGLAQLLPAPELDRIAVLTVRSLGGGNIEEHALAVFESWKLGRRQLGER